MAHKPEALSLFDEKLFQSDGVTDITAKLASTGISTSNGASAPHALAILDRIANDATFAPSALGLPAPVESQEQLTDLITRIAGDSLLKYVEQWTIDLNANASAEVFKAKFEELVWMNTLIYGVAGWAGRAQSWDENKEFNGDFLL